MYVLELIYERIIIFQFPLKVYRGIKRRRIMTVDETQVNLDKKVRDIFLLISIQDTGGTSNRRVDSTRNRG